MKAVPTYLESIPRSKAVQACNVEIPEKQHHLIRWCLRQIRTNATLAGELLLVTQLCDAFLVEMQHQHDKDRKKHKELASLAASLLSLLLFFNTKRE